MKRALPSLLAAMVALAAAAAMDSATLTRATALLQSPFGDAPAVAQLTAGTGVSVGERQGGWYRVSTAEGVSGWTRMSSVRFAEKKDASGFNQVAGLIQSGRSGSTGATATTGVRGLDETDLARAQPDAAALDRVSEHAVAPAQAAQFAAAIGLQSAPYPLQGGGR